MTAEFTGERVIPGLVDADLWNEHVARYVFASRFASGQRVLDIGCGAGYGSALLARNAAAVVGFDRSVEAVTYAREHYSHPNLTYSAASCDALPVRSGLADLVVCFEVIEHVEAWRDFLAEVRRVLAPGGLFVVSTPNIHYYAETRRQSGPNRFHEHEFEYDEFRDELRSVFPNVSMWVQNHSDSIVFRSLEPAPAAEAAVDAGVPEPSESHFFIALCSVGPLETRPAFVYLPTTANVLRERELHIEKLEGELAIKDRWLAEASAEHTALLAEHRKLHDLYRDMEADLETANRWAHNLDEDLKISGARVIALQQEIAGEHDKAARVVESYEAKIAELDSENEAKTQWALETERRLGGELQAKCEELAKCVDILHAVEAERDERSLHAAALDRELAETRRQLEIARAQMQMAQASRWVRLGRAFHIGPDLSQGTGQ